MRNPIASLLTVLVTALAVLSAGPAAADPIEVRAVAVPLHQEQPDLARVGKLTYRGGLELLSPSDRFGGFSALGLSRDGKRLVALSDEGSRLDAHLVYDADGNLAGLEKAEIFILTGPGGIPLLDKRLGDAEAMAPGVGGEIIVAFEQQHRLWVYPPDGSAPHAMPKPREMRTAPRNNGIEALTLLDDGRLFALSEGLGRGGVILGWVSDPRGWNVLTYRSQDGFLPTGAATLPGGDVLLVERYFTPRENVRVRLRRIKAADIAPGADLAGELLADLRPPFTVDNFEAVEAITGPKGETLVFILSDDNFKRRDPQKTLLMMFRLED